MSSGLETVRRDNPLFVSRMLEELLKMMLLDSATQDQIGDYVRACMQKILMLDSSLDRADFIMSQVCCSHPSVVD